MGSPPGYVPRVDFERYYYDRLADLGLTEDEALEAFAPHGMKKTGITVLLRNPRIGRAEQLRAFIEVLEVEDGFNVFVKAFGFGYERMSPNDYNDLFNRNDDGRAIDLVEVPHAA